MVESLNEIESNYYDVKLCDWDHERGWVTQLGAAVNGICLSSTRPELVAIIMGLMVPWAIKVNSDSKSAIMRATDMMNGKFSTMRAKPWLLRRDGDLWELLEKVLEWRQPGATTTKWVKGHATEAHIEQGVITAEDASGNDKADKMEHESVTTESRNN